MQLKELVNLDKKFKSTKGHRPLFNVFLNKLQSLPSKEITLDNLQKLELAEIIFNMSFIPDPRQAQFLKSLQHLFKEQERCFLKMVPCILDTAGYQQLNAMEDLTILDDLLNQHGDWIVSNRFILQCIINLITSSNDIESIHKCIKLLSNNDIVSIDALRWLTAQINNLEEVAKFLTILEEGKLISLSLVTLYNHGPVLQGEVVLLQWLHDKDIAIQKEHILQLVAHRCDEKNVFLLDILNILLQYGFDFNKEDHQVLSYLLALPLLDLAEKKDTLLLVQQKILHLDRFILRGVVSHKRCDLLMKILELQNNIIGSIFPKLLTIHLNEYSFEILYFLNNIDFLSEYSLNLLTLHQKTLRQHFSLVLQGYLNFVDCKIDINKLNFTHFEIMSALKIIDNLIQENALYLLTSLMSLKLGYFNIFCEILNGLVAHQQFNQENFEKVKAILEEKLQQPRSYDIRDYYYPQHQAITCEFKTTHEDKVFLGVSVSRGGRAEIYKALLIDKTLGVTSANTAAPYLVKKFFSPKAGDLLNNSKESKRETKYLQFMNQPAIFCDKVERNSILPIKPCLLITPWIQGEDLAHTPNQEILRYKIDIRFSWLLQPLKQLVLLHQKLRVHGDIKPLNCILNLHEGKLTLIDFGGARKLKKRNYALTLTRTYVDPLLPLSNINNHYRTCDDIYQFGYIIALLFPEIFLSYELSHQMRVSCIQPVENMIPIQKAIYTLFSNMMSPKREERCTAQRAIDYCEAILAQPSLSLKKIKQIKQETLGSCCEVDDIIQGHTQRFNAANG